jgi:hypothetical protein
MECINVLICLTLLKGIAASTVLARLIVTELQAFRYEFDFGFCFIMDPDWGRNSVRVRIVSKIGFNQIEQTLAESERLGLVSGRGISPFAPVSVVDGLNLSFDNGFDDLGYPVDIDAITLAFLVDVDKSTPVEANRWISRCAAK